jgi:two-component system capsular synthesis sensor histidine kinase RcsC
MKQANSRLGTLATSSQRHNKLLLLLASLALLLACMCYWAIGRVFNEEKEKLTSDFNQFMQCLAEYETFLRLGASLYSRANQNIVTYIHPSSSKLVLQHGTVLIYESRGLPQSLPYTLSQEEQHSDTEMQGAFSWGIQLTDFYNTYWASASYTAPQLFLFSPARQFSIAVPYIDAPLGKKLALAENFPQVNSALYQRLQAERSKTNDSQVRWMLAPSGLDHGKRAMIGYIGIDLPDRIMPTRTDHGLSMLTVLLERDDINLSEHTLAQPINSHFSLISPTGDVLLGDYVDAAQSPPGLRLDRYGLRFILKSAHSQPWTGVYSIGFQSLYQYLKWTLLAVAALLTLAPLIGWRLNRWHRTRIVEPAERANQDLTESVAFSRAILDNAPIGLCVVDRSSRQVLLENQRAQQWQGTGELLNALSLDFNDDEQGEVQIKVAERHLQAGFASTRYQGKDVVLCAFNDITRHVAATKLMDQARHSADETSKAKTRFLATIGHEIRTPLYGVLGNLELLALTQLDECQRDYVTTIEHSSSALFQLISNVLDVTNIDAGQMAIESVTFCLLDLFEDAARAQAAAARAKGLQLYTCADGNLPALVCGDPKRLRQIIDNLLGNAIKFTDFGQVALRLKVDEINATEVHLQWQISDTGRGMSEHMRAKLFTPFAQLSAHDPEEGAGLGLSLCSRLCELMHADLRVVSEPGLGSSFSLSIVLPIVPGELPHADNIQIRNMAVLVRAPGKELEQSLIKWLSRWGAQAQPAAQDREQAPSAILVDVSAESGQPQWRLIPPPDNADSTPESDAIGYDIRAIARALTQLHQGAPSAEQVAQRQSPGPHGPRILIAEENSVHRTILQQQLQTLGAQTTVASNGESALRLWAAEAFDLVIADVNMQTLNGYELARALRRQGVCIPIIGVTVNGLREEGDLCLAAGMDAWLIKPLNLQQLHEILHTWCTPAERPTEAEPDLNEGIQLSPQMRQLFVETMKEDLSHSEQALLSGDREKLSSHLHRMNGALAAVHAQTLSDALSQWEVELKSKPLHTDSIRELRALLSRINSAALALGKSLSP